MADKSWSPPVPDLEHEDGSFDWNDVQLFLLVAQSGSFRRASKKSNRSYNALRRRIRQLEQRLGCRLFARDVRGVHLTEAGQHLFQAGLVMLDASHRVSSALRRTGPDRVARVTLGVEEGLGVYWLLPRLADFHQANPRLRVNLSCLNVDARSEPPTTDLVIQNRRPTINDLIVVRLGYVHEQLFAARQMMADCRNLQGACLIEREATTQPGPQFEEFRRSFSDHAARARTTTLCAQYQAIRCGSGIGLLPTYLGVFDRELVTLLDDIHCQTDIYLCYRSDLAQYRDVRTVIDWLKSVFNPRRHPWFGERFLPAHQMAQKKGATSK